MARALERPEGGTTMTLRKSVAPALTTVMALWSATAFADGGHWGRHGGSGGWNGAILRSVGLTDAQKAQIRQIYTSHRPQLRALGQQLRAAQAQLGDQLYGAGAPTDATLGPLTQQLDQLRSQLAKQRLQVALEIRNVLTADQLAKAAQVHEQLRQLHEQRRNLLQPTN
jgi:Spy/CpxP family protein refolding chaperone